MTNSIPDYHAVWRAALAETDAEYGERRLSDAAERAFWKRFMAGRAGYRPDPEAALILAELKRLLAGHRRDSALEIGPGWGNYTVELARWFGSLTCVDLSPDVLRYIRQLAVSESCGPIRTVCSSWEQYAAGPPVNVVFGYNCFYRMRDLKVCIRKMNQSATDLCVMGMSTVELPPAYAAFRQQLGLDCRHSPVDYMIIYNLLYQMGLEADVRIIRFNEHVNYRTWQDVLLGETAQLTDPAEALQKHRPEIERMLRPYFAEQPDGSYKGTRVCRGHLMSWTPAELRPRSDIHLMRT